MRLTKHSPLLAPVCIGLLFFSAAASFAGDGSEPSATSTLPLATAAKAVGIGQALDPGALEGYRGGASTVDNTVDIDGGVSGNSAQGIVTGDNVIDGGAFANSTGISTVIQNSGANVLIQNGTVVNVQFVDPGTP